MSNTSDILDIWAKFGGPGPDGQAEFSLVTHDATTAEDLQARIAAVVQDRPFEVREAFTGLLAEETGHRFWILAFPDLDAARGEDLAFEAARQLQADLGVQSVRPVMIDSLVGEAMVARSLGLEGVLDCSDDNWGPEARGWAPRGLGVLEAWKHTKGQGVTIASIDTGYSSHVELADVISDKQQLNLVEGGHDAKDRFSTDVLLPNPGHGTLVASVVASRGGIDEATGNTTGPGEVTGSAPQAKILPIRAIRSVVDIRQSRIPAAIEHAIAQECDVIVMALGSAFPIEPVEVALRAATQRGVVVVCAAGNCVGQVVFPARFAPQGLCAAIAAVDHGYAPWKRTSKGKAVTVSAFGEAVWGARKNSAQGSDTHVDRSQGTTLATSLTGGVAALWIAHHGGRQALLAKARAAGVTVQKLFNEVLRASAYKPPGWGDGLGAGLVNAGRLLAFPLTSTLESVLIDVPLDEQHVTPLKQYLAANLDETASVAGLEAAGLDESLAAEALWRSYLAVAKTRAEAFRGASLEQGALESVGAGGPKASPRLSAALAGRPHLADQIGSL
ncbi:S8 family peptidase [Caulobacter endophyticus]|uniref:S8 family peptidase n=1 Tax=Caulobacter endophyticus TaxID=2172652 RepID=UPI00240F162D|nr:S8 family serine peptidase [Caulobacter endophyticus]MDG2528484.1 S8 family serine peptidase [Caulobacter endophyticus]